MISIGYVGIEAFDIILYIGKTLSVLKYPVLIADLSNTEALAKTIYHGMELDSANSIIHYRNINYIRRIPTREELDEFSNGMLFVVYGFNYLDNDQLQLDFLNIVLDPFPNSVCRINKALCNASIDNIRLRVLVRNIITIDDLDRVKASILLKQTAASTNHLYYDILDYENALRCQVFQVICCRKISSKMKRFIMSEACELLPGIKQSTIRRAFHLAMKGERCR